MSNAYELRFGHAITQEKDRWVRGSIELSLATLLLLARTASLKPSGTQGQSANLLIRTVCQSELTKNAVQLCSVGLAHRRTQQVCAGSSLSVVLRLYKGLGHVQQ